MKRLRWLAHLVRGPQEIESVGWARHLVRRVYESESFSCLKYLFYDRTLRIPERVFLRHV